MRVSGNSDDWCAPYERSLAQRLTRLGRPTAFLIVSSILASYLAHTFQNLGKKNALGPLHYELALMSKSLQKRLDVVESNTRTMVVLLKRLSEGVESGEMGNLTEGARKQLQTMVDRAVSLYDADKTGKTDYAMESLGACVVSVRDTPSYDGGSLEGLWLLGLHLGGSGASPGLALRPGLVPGHCWAFKGSRGRLVLRLAATVSPSEATLEHLPIALSPSGDISSAPKDFSVWGLTGLDDPSPFLLGRHSYLQAGPPVQSFPLEGRGRYFKVVELVVESNHGNPDYTCLYRFRLHGEQPPLHSRTAPSIDHKK